MIDLLSSVFGLFLFESSWDEFNPLLHTLFIFGEGFLEAFPINMSQDMMRLPVEVSEGQLTEELIGLFCAWYNVWLILAVVEVCCGTQLLILLPFSELLYLRQVAWKLMAIQSAFDLFGICKLKKRVVQKKGFKIRR